MNQMASDEIKPISSQSYLTEILNSGWSLVGPRKDPEKDFKGAMNFFKQNISFFPEHVLKADGFTVVPPSPYTRGHKLMYKDEGKLIRYTRSKYTLISGEERIPLYVFLKEEETDL